jgi:4-hydroxy-3-methylbut-2-enyl diphosphate reductase
MKKFQIPEQFKSSFTGKVKQWRKQNDPRKKDFTPSIIPIGQREWIFPRHMGFCYGVENAIEIAFKAVEENQGKRVFLLGEMIHNPAVNQDLISMGVQFIMDTAGNRLMDWDELSQDDVVITPAFGTTIEIEQQLHERGVDVKRYNTTCPFVEKVWKRSGEIGQEGYSIIIHGKYKHEETRATFSHSNQYSKSLVIRNLMEAEMLVKYIMGSADVDQFFIDFKGKYSEGFDPLTDLRKIGVVNQTTMLATETEEISKYLKDIVTKVNGDNAFADTRDTLCYATNDNQDAAMELLKTGADVAFIIGGHNSSNTYQLAIILSEKIKTFFIESADDLNDLSVNYLNLKTMTQESENWNETLENCKKIVIASGASCPDTLVDEVINKLCQITNTEFNPEKVLAEWMK